MLGTRKLSEDNCYFQQMIRLDLLSCAARNAVQAAQGLAALQEGVTGRSLEDPGSSSGRHLAHPSTRHRHSGSGSASWQQRSSELPFTPSGRTGPGASSPLRHFLHLLLVWQSPSHNIEMQRWLKLHLEGRQASPEH